MLTPAIKVLIVDDHPAVRLGLAEILRKFSDITVIGTAGSGMEALQLCSHATPDVAIVDIFMPVMDGLETMTTIQELYPNVKLIALTHSEREEDIINAMELGALGYLLKNADIDTIHDGIRAAHQGRNVLSAEVLETLIRAKTTPRPHPDNQLTEREFEVLHLMAQGKKNAQIAETLVITLSTVKFHASMIFKKLEVESRTEAVVKALEMGITTRGAPNVPGEPR